MHAARIVSIKALLDKSNRAFSIAIATRKYWYVGEAS